ncbi:peptidylprolyl isomerase [Rhodospirillum rubrum]|uniref:peptidylprolyl isomerase n=1 Tax=Rhodospirillum rubrum TaxID=1085 RepID=UPI001906504F|nr:peptidylprolyl isomerase [Rhodospirillum rubrum]MBK1663734.1 peptidylprolyl isomerase [Rhodospirillum rubrum]MBK1676485.1 peptidylprolyl isomerase [Rhodospirillum rubrum]
MMSPRARRLALAGVLALPLFAGPALAADPDPVVAVVNGADVHLSAVQERFAELQASQPQLGGLPLAMVYEQLLNSVVEAELVTEAGRKAGLANDPEVKHRLDRLLDRLIAGAYMQKVVDEDVTDAAVKARYDEMKAEFKPEKEVHARHILLETEDAAKDAIKKIEGGADFTKLASELSTGPSAQTGGDLGFFTKDRMVAPFAEAAFAMKVGEVSKVPTKTEFGWHVIKIEEVRDTTFPPVEEMESHIRDELANAAVEKNVAGLKESAKVKLFAADGKTTLEEAKAAAEKQRAEQEKAGAKDAAPAAKP